MKELGDYCRLEAASRRVQERKGLRGSSRAGKVI